MPHTYTKEELEERYKKLPAALKDAMFSPEVAEKMFEIGKKNGLTIEKTGFMAEETGFIILGLTQPREFVKILSDRLETDKDTASKIASDINHAILFPLREALKSAHNMEVGEAQLHSPVADMARVSGASKTPAIPGHEPGIESRGQITTKIEPILRPLAPPPMKPVSPSTPPPPIPEKKQETAGLPATAQAGAPIIPGFISRQDAEKIVAGEKEKRQAPAAPEKILPPQIPPAPAPNPAQIPAPIILQALSQPIPKQSTVIPPETPEQKNTIDLRDLAPREPAPAPLPVQKQPQPAPFPITPPAPPIKPVMPPPIVIPPSPKPEPLPEEMRPQNPKIQPIDLRGAKPQQTPKQYDGYDPYREPME